jgi:hypothetical protein
MCWDHPSMLDEATRPERSVHDLAARIQTTWYKPESEEVWANVRPITSDAAEFLEEAGEMIEVSINALGQARFGPAPDGQPAKIVEKIVRGTADFVTMAGAGGRLVPLFEAFRSKKVIQGGEESMDLKSLTLAQLKEARPDLFSQVPGADLATFQAELKALRESNVQLSTKIVDLETQRDGAVLLSESQKAVARAIAAEGLPGYAAQKLAESFAGRSFVKDGKVDAEGAVAAVKAAAAAERTYIAQIAEAAGGKVLTGFGAGTQDPNGGEDAAQKAAKAQKLRESTFVNMGYSPEQAARMAAEQ